ncbi:MAG: hypothetical protein K2X87_25710, partial [Gemmataceae bacterium]|nr:hypothetical protein [Gemmataceae bacterium]
MTQAVCDYRRRAGIAGPAFVGRDARPLSGLARGTALGVLAANGVRAVVPGGDGAVPAPAISWAVVAHNRRGTDHLADGIVLATPDDAPGAGGSGITRPTAGWPTPRWRGGPRSGPTSTCSGTTPAFAGGGPGRRGTSARTTSPGPMWTTSGRSSTCRRSGPPRPPWWSGPAAGPGAGSGSPGSTAFGSSSRTGRRARPGRAGSSWPPTR